MLLSPRLIPGPFRSRRAHIRKPSTRPGYGRGLDTHFSPRRLASPAWLWVLGALAHGCVLFGRSGPMWGGLVHPPAAARRGGRVRAGLTLPTRRTWALGCAHDSPARARIDLHRVKFEIELDRFPRTREDRPVKINTQHIRGMVPPHARG